ncbi:hypothetical protein MKO06_09260 [Gramella sp. GC03-9]|uniref:Sensor of ECF-type sigma factor n=1 Tax=Christiangramia oceanisediminis TaxID=2920386 RepID=A0A9X2I575_9FLAO|nr:hypothetical protein [Gramella oceanisediminis]MCP9200095.1 hypothetical protein [Gramella oceanisediminis]
MMKKAILILFVLFASSNLMAQETDSDRWERIKALKVAFFTQEMNFTNKVAEKFWPIYNKYEKSRRELHRREHVDVENVECISEQEANRLLEEFLNVENEEYQIKKQLFRDLKEIISAKDIIKLHKLEGEFHKKLIKEYRSKKENKDSNSSE